MRKHKRGRRCQADEDRDFCVGLTLSPRLNDEEKVLVRLRKLEGLSWKEVLRRYNQECRRQYRPEVLEMGLSRLTMKMKSIGSQSQAVVEDAHPVVHPPMPETQPSVGSYNAELPLVMETLIQRTVLNQNDWWFGHQSNTELFFQNSSSYAPILQLLLSLPTAN